MADDRDAIQEDDRTLLIIENDPDLRQIILDLARRRVKGHRCDAWGAGLELAQPQT